MALRAREPNLQIGLLHAVSTRAGALRRRSLSHLHGDFSVFSREQRGGFPFARLLERPQRALSLLASRNGAMMQTFAVTVPPGIGAGQQFQASLDGQLTMVIVPHGSTAGSTLHVQIPVRPSSVQKYAVTIPANVRPGDRFQANLGGQLVCLWTPTLRHQTMAGMQRAGRPRLLCLNRSTVRQSTRPLRRPFIALAVAAARGPLTAPASSPSAVVIQGARARASATTPSSLPHPSLTAPSPRPCTLRSRRRSSHR